MHSPRGLIALATLLAWLAPPAVQPHARAQCSPLETGLLRLQIPASNDYFGTGVALDWPRAAVGAYSDDPDGTVTIFEWTGAAWSRTATIVSPAPGSEGFGTGVALDDDTLIVGNANNGPVRVFHLIQGTWTFAQSLPDPNPPGGQGYSKFGLDLDLDGDLLAVTAIYDNFGASNTGAVHLFRRNGTQWNFEATLRAPTPIFYGQFGSDVAVSGDAVLVGQFSDGEQGEQAGAAFIYRRTAGVWQHEATLRGSLGRAGDYFGATVSLDGDTAAIGAYGHDVGAVQNAGIIYIFDRQDSTWVQTHVLTGSYVDQGLGGNVELEVNTLVASSGASAAIGRVYTRGPQGWAHASDLVPVSSVLGANGGWALQNTRVLAGAPFTTIQTFTRAGVVLSFDLAQAPPAIVTPPAPVAVAPGQEASFSVAASSPSPVTYRWRLNGMPIPEFPPFSGVNTATLTINPATPLYAGAIDVVVSASCGGYAVSPPAAFHVFDCPADLTSTAIPGSPGYGTPNGVLTNDDFFYYLALFAAGC